MTNKTGILSPEFLFERMASLTIFHPGASDEGVLNGECPEQWALSATGVGQAQALVPYFQEHRPDIIMSSSALNAVQTLNIALKQNSGGKVSILNELRPPFYMDIDHPVTPMFGKLGIRAIGKTRFNNTGSYLEHAQRQVFIDHCSAMLKAVVRKVSDDTPQHIVVMTHPVIGMGMAWVLNNILGISADPEGFDWPTQNTSWFQSLVFRDEAKGLRLELHPGKRELSFTLVPTSATKEKSRVEGDPARQYASVAA